MTKNPADIGLRQGKKICRMSHRERIKFISEGLPIIMESANSLMAAAQSLSSFPRESEILKGLAEEECAKILILLDIVRCPSPAVENRINSMMKWFYSHLARLLYAKCQGLRPSTPNDLQKYIDAERRSHFIEGYAGEYISPNWNIYSRESALYADIQCDGENEISWHSPNSDDYLRIKTDSKSHEIVNSLYNLGAFTLNGLENMHAIWEKVDFSGEIDLYIKHELEYEMVKKFINQGITSERDTQNDVYVLYDYWQIPMYQINFEKKVV